jgi:hypothetical protein
MWTYSTSEVAATQDERMHGFSRFSRKYADRMLNAVQAQMLPAPFGELRYAQAPIQQMNLALTASYDAAICVRDCHRKLRCIQTTQSSSRAIIESRSEVFFRYDLSNS